MDVDNHGPPRFEVICSRAVHMDTGHFGLVNSDSILWRVRPATLVTSASEHNGHSDLGPSDCVAST